MIIMTYTDLYDSFIDEEGIQYDVIVKKHVNIPIHINENDIKSISPSISKDGKLFKNVSIITDNFDTKYKVVGNYKDIYNKINGRNEIGFNGKKSKDSNN